MRPLLQIADMTERIHDGDVLEPFAYEELQCRRVGEGESDLLHLWRHRHALVLGLRDRRLSGAGQAMARARAEGVSVGVRNSGGAAVPLDAGVVNVSWIVPKEKGEVGYRGDFERLADWIGRAVRACGAEPETGEISGSYCPGDFDLGIGGRKFCGIAQRRQIQASIIQAFVVVEGSGRNLAERASTWYARAAGNADSGYPVIRDGAMASLDELIGGMTVRRFVEALIANVDYRHVTKVNEPYAAMTEAIQDMASRIRNRYDKP